MNDFDGFNDAYNYGPNEGAQTGGSAPIPNDPSPASAPDLNTPGFPSGGSGYQSYDSSVDSPGQVRYAGRGFASGVAADNRSPGNPDLGKGSQRDQEVYEEAHASQLAANTMPSAAINPDVAEENIPVPSFGRQVQVPVDPNNPQNTETVNVFSASTTIDIVEDKNQNGQETGSVTINIKTDFSNLTTHKVDEETGNLAERRVDVDYTASATITINSTALQDGGASPDLIADIKQDIEILAHNFRDRVEQLRSIGLEGEYLEKVQKERGSARMDRFASENQIGQEEIRSILQSLETDLQSLKTAEHISLSCIVDTPVTDVSEEDQLIKQASGSHSAVVINPGMEPGASSSTVASEVAAINPTADPGLLEAGSSVTVNPDGLEQEAQVERRSRSGTFVALQAWAEQYNETVAEGVDQIARIQPVDPILVEKGDNPLASAVNAFGRYEAFLITDNHIDKSQWDSVRVERNVDGTFIRLSKDGDKHLEFRIGSRNMTQSELEGKLNDFMPLIGTDGAFDQDGHLQNSPLLAELCRLDGRGEGVALTSAKGITFDKVDLIAVNLDGAKFTDCTFSGCIINASMAGTVFENCKVNKRSSVTVANAEGMVITGRQSIWDTSVDFQGNVKGISIGGKRFSCNTLAIKDWRGSEWHYDEAGGPMKLVKGIMIFSNPSNGVPTEIDSKLVPVGQWKLGAWNNRQAMSNREYFDRVQANPEAFQAEKCFEEDGKLHIEFKSPNGEGIRMHWQGADDRWGNVLQRMSWKNPVSWFAEPINQIRKDFLGASILGSNLETDILSSLSLEVRGEDGNWVAPATHDKSDRSTIDHFATIARVQLDPDAAEQLKKQPEQAAA